MFRKIVVLCCLTTPLLAQTPAAPSTPTPAEKSKRTLTLDDLFSDPTVVDAAISPSGQYLALIMRREDDDLLLTYDLKSGQKKVLQRVLKSAAGKNLTMRLGTVYWKSEDRLLFRAHVRPLAGKSVWGMSDTTIGKLGDRLFAVDRDGGNLVGLLGDNHNSALEGAFDLGDIASFLPNDPQHILMELNGWNGRSLFKVDLSTGKGEQLERPMESVVGWWLDLDGNPVVRIQATAGTVRLFRKQEGKWVQFLKMRAREMKERPEYEPVGASDQEGKYYVLARPPGHDRTGLYLYDLEHEQFGEPVIENAVYDIASVRISRDGKRVLFHCYMAHVRVCEFEDAKFNSHIRGLRRYFEQTANVYIFDSSQDSKTFLLYVEGPRDPPGYYYYRVDEQNINTVGIERTRLGDVLLPDVKVVDYKARDGKPLSGYLTTPANAPKDVKLPLIVYPHGGPEMRDRLTYDPWVQFFVSRGYAVFQPNFRGSDGFGRAFAESGYGEWGRKMQDDITFGVKKLIADGVVDPKRICIIGGSYGGYAALAGATLTPDLYACAVSVNGVSNLPALIGRSARWSDWAEDYWDVRLGSRFRDKKALEEVSPTENADKAVAPIMIIHGRDDTVVPFSHAIRMRDALKAAGKSVELVELKGEDHWLSRAPSRTTTLEKSLEFVNRYIGPR